MDGKIYWRRPSQKCLTRKKLSVFWAIVSTRNITERKLQRNDWRNAENQPLSALNRKEDKNSILVLLNFISYLPLELFVIQYCSLVKNIVFFSIFFLVFYMYHVALYSSMFHVATAPSYWMLYRVANFL